MPDTNRIAYLQFLDIVSEKTDIPVHIVKTVCDAMVSTIGDEVYRGNEVQIRNFGIFKSKKMKGRNVHFENIDAFPDYTRFIFQPSQSFTKKNRARIGEHTGKKFMP